MTSNFQESKCPHCFVNYYKEWQLTNMLNQEKERKVVKCLWCLFSEIHSLPPVNNNLFLSDYINMACCNQYLPWMNMLLGTGSDCNICYPTLQFSFYWITTFICNSSIDFVPTSFLKMEEDWPPGVLTLLFQLGIVFE